MNEKSVLFVCYGNICRSPMAEEIFKKMKKKSKWFVESCGTGDHFEGSKPDSRTLKVLKQKYGKTFSTKKRARGIKNDDFKKFKYILCMDEDNLEFCLKMKKKLNSSSDVSLITKYSKYSKVNDPYYGNGIKEFEKTFEICQESISNFLKEKD